MICRQCQAELRFGWRDGQAGWWHRENVDHSGVPVVPPADPYVAPVIPEPEEPCHSITVEDLRPRSGPRQIANLLPKHGWEIRRMTASKGPYINARGEVSRISDSIVMSAVHPDGRRLVACWVDVAFEFAYIGRGAGVTACNATELKGWIKGTHDLPDAVPDVG